MPEGVNPLIKTAAQMRSHYLAPVRYPAQYRVIVAEDEASARRAIRGRCDMALFQSNEHGTDIFCTVPAVADEVSGRFGWAVTEGLIRTVTSPDDPAATLKRLELHYGDSVRIVQ